MPTTHERIFKVYPDLTYLHKKENSWPAMPSDKNDWQSIKPSCMFEETLMVFLAIDSVVDQ